MRLVGAMLIDGTGTAPLPKCAVEITAGKISSIVPGYASTTVTQPARDDMDVSDLTLMPGLIECHDHFAWHGRTLEQRWGFSEPQSTRYLRTALELRRVLEAGYTTVRDAAGLDIGFKQAIEEGLIVGPRLVLTVNIISGTGGIGDRFSPSGHQIHLLDPMLPEGVADGPDQMRQVVRLMIRAGADVIKCAVTGGATSRSAYGPRDALLTRDEMEALISEAHLHGRKVMCHALGGPALRMAVEAGVDSIEHGCFLDDDSKSIELMATRGIFFVPTLTEYAHSRKSKSVATRSSAEMLHSHHEASVRMALAAGVRIAAGCDTGSQMHGVNAEELTHLVAAGLSPMQAIQAATSWAAECLGMDDEVGTIQPGKFADLIAVQGDPLKDIGILQHRENIKLVVKGGVVVADRLNDHRLPARSDAFARAI